MRALDGLQLNSIRHGSCAMMAVVANTQEKDFCVFFKHICGTKVSLLTVEVFFFNFFVGENHFSVKISTQFIDNVKEIT